MGNECVDSFKHKIHQAVGLAPCQQRLYFAGQLLNDTVALSDYGIQHGSTVNLAVTFRGGAPNFPTTPSPMAQRAEPPPLKAMQRVKATFTGKRGRSLNLDDETEEKACRACVAGDCSICLFPLNERYVVSHCSSSPPHYFHAICLEEWRRRQAPFPTCPLCRVRL